MSRERPPQEYLDEEERAALPTLSVQVFCPTKPDGHVKPAPPPPPRVVNPAEGADTKWLQITACRDDTVPFSGEAGVMPDARTSRRSPPSPALKTNVIPLRARTKPSAPLADVIRLPCQQHDPSLWFSNVPAELNLAKAHCRGCGNRMRCLAGALERGEPAGVWGGEIFDHGRIIDFKRPRGRPPKQAS